MNANSTPRLTLDDRLDIAARYRDGQLVEVIAAQYGVAPTTISRIAHRAGVPPRLRRAGHPGPDCDAPAEGVEHHADPDPESPSDITGWRRVNRGGIVRWVKPERAA